MPRPRSTEQQEPDLETLPPVSEEELDAIKARLSSPDRADQPGGEVNNAEIDRRLSQRNTWWVFSGITGLVGLGAALWWATTRRKRKHAVDRPVGGLEIGRASGRARGSGEVR